MPVRAGLEAATLTNVAGGLVILDSVVDQDHATVDDVLARYAKFSAPGSRRLQLTVRLVRQGANSAGESLSRHMFWAQHLPEPVLQFEVRDEHGVLIGPPTSRGPRSASSASSTGGRSTSACVVRARRSRKPCSVRRRGRTGCAT